MINKMEERNKIEIIYSFLAANISLILSDHDYLSKVIPFKTIRIILVLTCPLLPFIVLSFNLIETIYLEIIGFSFKQSKKIVFTNWKICIIDENRNILIHEHVPYTLNIIRWVSNLNFPDEKISCPTIIGIVVIYQAIVTIIANILRYTSLEYALSSLEARIIIICIGIIGLFIYESIFKIKNNNIIFKMTISEYVYIKETLKKEIDIEATKIMCAIFLSNFISFVFIIYMMDIITSKIIYYGIPLSGIIISLFITIIMHLTQNNDIIYIYINLTINMLIGIIVTLMYINDWINLNNYELLKDPRSEWIPRL